MRAPRSDGHSHAGPSTPPSANLKRRRFLLALGASGAGAAVIAATPVVASTEALTQPAAPEPSGGYRETQHVLDYYDTARV